jgi:DNA-binding transcriptional MerR regulator
MPDDLALIQDKQRDDRRGAGWRHGRGAGFDLSSIERELSIGELCEVFGLTPRTLRFWEMQGLIFSTRHGNRRFYSREAIARLRKILKLKSLEFTLVEIRRLMAVSSDIGECDISLSRETIEIQLDHLKQMKERFEQAIEDLSRLARAG